ncbi:asparagine synthase (glutamine-hydrolyzing) [Laspinema olomoucense]|uniref:asparagine synthase (glutamine-hydrolyzing) n=1 Tax=Laspinema olomoucense D3b TaxID=2953688 RepID=A0ABT2N1C1_9CYAN|nr:asparagine synthase (glutamine-hydrolyzing) [Laspinema sp. D3b]MCT7976480.1 asparagine synthase (glutamine-hydrolyzing) [Laspinema sp. D3b]
MCGICGWLDRSVSNPIESRSVLERMNNRLLHRGPDSGGIWVDETAGIALGHRRLAIVDLSPEGHQPMMSANDRYVISFNGEIYNFLELRRELENLGHRFRGGSDTEVMLAAFSEWGIEPAVKRFNGMFAFALWDRQERVLHLGRDRLGEKPLYYGWVNGSFLFASELKALKAHPKFSAEIDRDALALYLRFCYIPAPYSIYQGIYKLPPACLLTVRSPETHAEPIPYWSAKSTAISGISQPFLGSETEAIHQLDALLRDAVSLRMMADVPLGAFLSGGIDSSTLVALMQAQSTQPIKTFTIGTHEKIYNEADHAKAIAQHLGTDHTELYVTAEDALAVIPKLPTLYDEPFSDSSQIPTFLISQLTRKQVTVSLSGDGGDELFAGYNRHLWGRRFWQKLGWIPPMARQMAAGAITQLSPETWDAIFQKSDRFIPHKFKLRQPGDKLQKLAEVLAIHNPQSLYKRLVSNCKNPETVVLGSTEPPTVLSDSKIWHEFSDLTECMMYLDAVTYLPDDILAKVDRASMGVSLEARVPYLDHRVVEFAWQIPLRMKIRNGMGKWLLRQVLDQYVPAGLMERPKMGFAVPIERWLRGELRDWAEALLDERRLRQEGFFNPQPIREKWEEHLSGRHDWKYYLWDILMFQSWLEQQNNSKNLLSQVHQ